MTNIRPRSGPTFQLSRKPTHAKDTSWTTIHIVCIKFAGSSHIAISICGQHDNASSMGFGPTSLSAKNADVVVAGSELAWQTWGLPFQAKRVRPLLFPSSHINRSASSTPFVTVSLVRSSPRRGTCRETGLRFSTGARWT